MSDLLNTGLGSVLPSMPSISGSMISSIFLWLMIFFGVAIMTGLVAYFIAVQMKYNKVIKIFGNINGRATLLDIDKGYLARLGKAGDSWMTLKKRKIFIPRPRFKVGKNEYWLAERKDGELINFELENLDEKCEKMGIHFIDEDMRLVRIAMEKNLKERLMTQSFWEKYGTMISQIVFVVITSVCLIVLFRQLNSTASAVGSMASAVSSEATAVSELAESLDNMISGYGSGMYSLPLLIPFVNLKKLKNVKWRFWK